MEFRVCPFSLSLFFNLLIPISLYPSTSPPPFPTLILLRSIEKKMDSERERTAHFCILLFLLIKVKQYTIKKK
jgi:hypothetical protein